MQKEITKSGHLLSKAGQLNQVGWARQPLLDCNLEDAHFYPVRGLQSLRLKRWDYYAVFTPRRFFSATIADLGYAGNIFVYTLDFATSELHEEGLVLPFGKGIHLPRNSDSGESIFEDGRACLSFRPIREGRQVTVSWPGFHEGRGIQAEIMLSCPQQHESMGIVIPIGRRRFYYNRKINCMPAEGFIRYGQTVEQLSPHTSAGSLDWGRGVWAYRSFWNWASASGFLPDGRTLGLNLGGGFGDTSAATEDCLVLDGRIHKLDPVTFDYTAQDYHQPWKFTDSRGRLSLTFTPFKERVARTNLGIIFSEVHQMFGRYTGMVVAGDGETIAVDNLVGFAEEHRARW